VVDDTRVRSTSLDLTFYAPSSQDVEEDGVPGPGAEELADERVLAAIRSLIFRDSPLPTTVRNIRAEAGMRMDKVREALDRLVVTGKIRDMPGGGRGTAYEPTDGPDGVADPVEAE
jgi:hypothetical protein